MYSNASILISIELKFNKMMEIVDSHASLESLL